MNTYKTIKELLKISQKIVNDFEILTNLSYQNLENTNQFNETIKNLKNHLNTEANIISNIDLIDLEELFSKLIDFDNSSNAFNRIYSNMNNRIELLESKNDGIYFNNDTDDEYLPELSDDNDDESYYLDTSALKEYEEQVYNAAALKVLKKMATRIMNTSAKNNHERKYQDELFQDLKAFKYEVFASDLTMENIGVNCEFNVEKVKNIAMPDIDISTIAYNQCVTHLEMLYSAKKTENNFEDINSLLFNIMNIEVYLDYLDNRLLNKLLVVCNEIENYSSYQYFGKMAKSKILAKSKN